MPPRIETARLILRPFCDADIQAAYEVFEGHPDVYFYDPGFRRSFEQRAEIIRRYTAENDPHGCGTMAVVLPEAGGEPGRLIGYAGLQLYLLPGEPFTSAEVELFYKLGRDDWGKGYASEACRALLNYAFTELRLGRIVSTVHMGNQRSIRLLERLGARIQPAPPAWANYVIGVILHPEDSSSRQVP